MLTLNDGDYSRELQSITKNIFINGYTFLFGEVDSPIHNYVTTLFYKHQIDSYPFRQELFTDIYNENINCIFTGSKVEIGKGIVENSFVITYNNQYLIQDDGEGNLKSGNDIVGHIFYEHGVALLSSSNFSGSATPISIMKTNSNLVEVDFRKYEELVKTEINTTVKEDSFNASTNETFDSSIHKKLYISKLLFYNTRNELILTARLSQPIQLKDTIHFLLEHITVV